MGRRVEYWIFLYYVVILPKIYNPSCQNSLRNISREKSLIFKRNTRTYMFSFWSLALFAWCVHVRVAIQLACIIFYYRFSHLIILLCIDANEPKHVAVAAPADVCFFYYLFLFSLSLWSSSYSFVILKEISVLHARTSVLILSFLFFFHSLIFFL